MPLSVETVLPPPEITILDVLESPNYSTSLPATLVMNRRGSSLAAFAPPLLESVSGPVIAQHKGVLMARMTSASATVKSMASNRWVVPLGLDLAGTPAAQRNPTSWRLGYTVERIGPALVADVPLSLGWGYAFAPGALDNNFFAGYELVSVDSLNGGNWTVRIRQVDGGALTVVQDTGIPATAICALEIGYDFTTNPRCFAKVNGTEYGVVQGIASMPNGNSGNVFAAWIAQGLATASGTGQVDWVRQGRLRVTELPGFETT